MERPTKTLDTPEQKQLILKEYLTARERNEIKALYLSKTAINSDGANSQVQEINGALLLELEKKIITAVVISYNGQTENILETLLDGRPEEYDFVLEEARKIAFGNLT
jgi:hypothetical protein